MNTNTTNTVLRYTIYVFAAVTLFAPLIVSNGLFFPFITGKAFIFRIAVELAFAVWVILACRDASVRPKKSILLYTVTAFTVIALVADLAGVNPIRSLWSNFERMEGWITIVHLWAYFIVLSSVFKKREHWNQFFNVSFFIATIVSIWGILQFFGATEIHQSADRLDATLGNSEYLAVYMLIHVFLALYRGVSSIVTGIKNSSVLWPFGLIYIGLSLLYSLILVGTQTRGTTLALGASLFLTALLYTIFAKSEDPIDRVGRVISICVLSLIVIVSVGFYSVRNTHFVQSHNTLQRLANISFNNARIQFIWPIALKGFEQKPLLGWGQENFNYVFNDYYNPAAWGQEQWFDRAHNVFIDWAIAGGIVGFLGYLALFLSGILVVWKTSMSARDKSILTGLLVGYGIHNIFVFDNLASYMMFFIVLSYLAYEYGSSNDVHIGGEHPIDLEIANWVVAPIVLIVLASGFYFIDYRPYKANQKLIVALSECQQGGQPQASFYLDALAVNSYIANQEIREQLYSCAGAIVPSSAVPDADKLLFIQAVTKAADDQITATPADVRGYLFVGTFFNNIGQWDLSKKYLDTAYKLSPNKQSVLFQVALDDMNTGKVDEGLAVFKKAYELATDYPAAKSTYEHALIFQKKFAEAIPLLESSAIDNPSDVQTLVNLTIAYLGVKDTDKAIAELQKVGVANPQYKSQVDSYIAQIKAGKNPFDQAKAK